MVYLQRLGDPDVLLHWVYTDLGAWAGGAGEGHTVSVGQGGGGGGGHHLDARVEGRGHVVRGRGIS